MNSLTRLMVMKAIKTVSRNVALNNNIDFVNAVHREHSDYLTDKLGVDLQTRAQEIWRWWHPEDFDDEYIWNYDYQILLSERVWRIIDRKVARDPELQIDDWGDYPVQVLQPSPEFVREYYAEALEAAIERVTSHRPTHPQLCAFLTKRYGSCLPALQIADAAYNAIQEAPTLGLPLFKEL